MESTDVVLLIGLAIAAFILFSLTFREDHQAVLTQRMAAGAGLILTAEQIPLVRDKLGQRERGAIVGGILGAAASWILTTANFETLNGTRILLVVSGAVTGAAVATALVAVFAANQRPRDTVLVARSTSVSLADYSPRAARYIPRALIVLSIAAIVLMGINSEGREIPPAALILGIAAVLTLAVFEIFGRRVATKGQPAGSAIELVLDDALRATYLRDLAIAPAVLASYSIAISLDAARSWFEIAVPPWLGLVLYAAFVVAIFVGVMVSRARPRTPYYLRRLWPEIAAGGPGSTAIIDEPSR